MKSYLGIDIGGTSVKIGHISRNGELLTRTKEYKADTDGYKISLLNTALHGLSDYINTNKIKTSSIKAIGVSATGLIDTNKGEVVGAGSHVSNYIGSKIKESIEAKYHINTYVLNDANAAALGEMWMGNATKKKDFIVLTVGTGVGAGIVVDSRVLNGANGFGGEVGHMPLDIHGEKCYCGNRGCFEYLASTNALIRNIKKVYKKEIDGKDVFKLIEEGNQKVIDVYNDWLYCLAEGIVSLIHIFNPEAIYIGGGISKQNTLFIKPLKGHVKKLARKEFVKNLEFKSAKLKNNAGLFGAVYYCIQKEN